MKENIVVVVDTDTRKFETGIAKVERKLRDFRLMTRQTASTLNESLVAVNRIDRTANFNPTGTQMAAVPVLSKLKAAEQALRKVLELVRVPLQIADDRALQRVRVESALQRGSLKDLASAEAVSGLVQETASTTLFEVGDLNKAASLLARFDGLSFGNLEEALQRAVDLSESGFGDLQSATRAIGRALANPLKNFEDLNSSFEIVSPEQEALIRSFVSRGQVDSARQVILNALNQEVGGLGKRLGDSFTGLVQNVEAQLQAVLAGIGEGGLKEATERIGKQLAEATDPRVTLESLSTAREELAKARALTVERENSLNSVNLISQRNEFDLRLRANQRQRAPFQ